MYAEEDIEDIKRLKALIKAEHRSSEEHCYESDSSDSDDSDNESTSSTSDVEETDYVGPLNTNVDSSSNVAPGLDFNDINDLSSLSPHLSYEEFQLISECEDPVLKRLLMLNRIKKVQLNSLRDKYENMLIECDRNKKFEENKAFQLEEINRHSKTYNFTKVGCPYFRDKNNFPAPPNADMIKSIEYSEVNTLYFPKRKVWNVCNQASLKSNVMMNCFKNKLTCLEDQLKWAKIEKNEEEESDAKERIKMHTENFDEMKPPGLWDDTYLHWDDIALKQFNDVSTAMTCRAFWNLCIHPSINKTPIKGEEKFRLVKLAKKHGDQNWEQIAKELNTNRSPYLLASYYFNKCARRNNTSTTTNRILTEEETEIFEKLVKSNTLGNQVLWRKLKEESGLTNAYHRYRYKNAKFGKFSEYEDKLLACLAKKHNEDFDEVFLEMPHRMKKALMDRYYNKLKPPFADFHMWTVEQDKEILDYAEKNEARNWETVARNLSRAVLSVKNRYEWLRQRFNRNPNRCVENLPRICGKSRQTVKRLLAVHEALEHYMTTNELPKMEENYLDLNISRGRPQRSSIDHALTDFFRSTAHIRKERYRKSIRTDSIIKCSQSVHAVLNTLGVKLNIPDDKELESHLELNKIDVEVLKSLKTLCTPGASNPPKEDIPPNVNTIQALRCLLLRCGEFKSKVKQDISESDDPEVMLHRERFAERLRALFQWPCLMSIVEPPKDFEMEKEAVIPVSFMQEKRIGRPSKNMSKINKMNEARKKKKGKNTANIVKIKTVRKNGKEILTDEDEESVDSPEPISRSSKSSKKSKKSKKVIDLQYNPTPESSLIKMKLPEEIPDIHKTLASFMAETQNLNKNIQASQTKVLRKVSKQELEQMKKNGCKFMMFKSIKRPANSEPCEISKPKIIKLEPMNIDT